MWTGYAKNVIINWERNKMIDDYEAVMMKMEEIHSRWPSLRFCQVIENALGNSGKRNYYISDDNLITLLDHYVEINL